MDTQESREEIMGEIKAGVTLMQDFCRPNSDTFKSYVDYIDRAEAQRGNAVETYNLFHDYMGNPNKSTGLFTSDKDSLMFEEKRELKAVFETAQKNESLMWQTVISFDNQWLENNGLYDQKNGMLDEQKLKEVTRLAVNRMMKSEGLDHAVWSAAIHYNTDNIHVHVATVEPFPIREKIVYQGKEEVRGKFKLKNIEMCKSTVVNEIMQTREINLKLNQIIRKDLVEAARDWKMAQDPDVREKFLELYESLPKVDRKLLNYGNPVMKPYREKIDEINWVYIKKYHAAEYEEFHTLLEWQSRMYAEAYGKSVDRSYAEGKEQDLMKRMGNAVLKSLKSYERQIEKKEGIAEENLQKKENENRQFLENKKGTEAEREGEIERETDQVYDPGNAMQKEESEMKGEADNIYAGYFSEWKKVKKILNNEDRTRKEEKEMKELLEKGIREQNPFLLHQMGELCASGRTVEIDLEKAEEFFRQSLERFQRDVDQLSTKEPGKFSFQDYVRYRIGKQYDRGWGTEKDAERAAACYRKSGTDYAKFSLGNLYFYGNGVEQDYQMAAKLYHEIKEFPFSDLKLAWMYSKGAGVEKDDEKAEKYSRAAFEGFEKMERKEKSDLTEYQLGKMSYYGQGCEQNLEQAIKYLELSAQKKNVPAQLLLNKIYIEYRMEDKIPDALKVLEELAEKGKKEAAQYALGKFYADKGTSYYDPRKSVYYLKQVAGENEYAKYALGKIYLDRDSGVYSPGTGIRYMEELSENGNSAAQIKLGFEYLKGESVKRDVGKSAEYFEKAAAQGEELAKEMLLNLASDQERYQKGRRGKGRRTITELDRALFRLQKTLRQEEIQTLKNIRQYDMELDYELEKYQMI